MSLHITPKTFAIGYTLYVLISFISFLIVSNTIPAWIVYGFGIAPFYWLCFAYVAVVAWKNRHRSIKVRRSLLYLVAIAQATMMLSSPASCYGWKQGQDCYSLIQTLFVAGFTHENLMSLPTQVPHWQLIESAFPIAVGLYALAMIVCLGLIRVEPLPSV